MRERALRMRIPGRTVLAVAVAVLACFGIRAQLSPGPLSAAHENLDSAFKCLECHGRGDGAMPDRCVACHAEINWLKSHDRGLHGREGAENCADCHREHGGRENPLVVFAAAGPDAFDHARTGWPLEGKHAASQCADCHNERLRVSGVVKLSPRKDPSRGYIGLEPECSTCHATVHRGSFGTTCAECHAPAAPWRDVHDFDHARTGYRLTGSHAKVACAKCHPSAPARRAQPGILVASRVLAPIAHAECSSCHRDVHAGRAGTNCSTCHTTAAFQRVAGVTFDHSSTGFALIGKHAAVACERCHQNTALTVVARSVGEDGKSVTVPRHERCSDCHVDGHAGQLADLPGRGDCASCHQVEGWKPSTFSVAEHATVSFPLEGRHATVECATCHAPGAKGPAGRVDPETLGTARIALELGDPTCVACHADPHEGRFAVDGPRPKVDGCRGCHDQRAFRPSIITAAVHRDFPFPAQGAHATVACELCHQDLRQRRVDPEVALRFAAETTCESCHALKSPHGNQFANRRAGEACGGCHDELAFRPATRFDHRRDTRFPLLRSHANVECVRCHRPEPGPSGKTIVRYRPTSFECKGCHERTAPELPSRAIRTSGP